MSGRDAPTAAVQTARLTLSPVTGADVDDLCLLYRDPLVDRWTGPWTDAAVREWTTDMARRWEDDGVGKWMARDRVTGTLIGRGGMTRMDLAGEQVLEVGWVIRDACTGRGYATELGRAAFAWADDHFPELPVVAFTEIHNHASIAVMQRLGMTNAGRLAREGLIDGRPGLHPRAAFTLYRR